MAPRPEAEGALPRDRDRAAALLRAAHAYLCISEARYGG